MCACACVSVYFLGHAADVDCVTKSRSLYGPVDVSSVYWGSSFHPCVALWERAESGGEEVSEP